MVTGRLDSPFQLETVPGDHIKIDVAALTRSMTLNTASFLRGKFTFDFFFVPYSQLWHPFNQFISQRKDNHTTLQKGIANVPVINLGDLLKMIIQVEYLYRTSQPSIYQLTADIHDNSWTTNTIRMLDLMGYGNFTWLLNWFDGEDFLTDYQEVMANMSQRFGDKYVNIFRLAAYQHVWYDFYRNKWYDNYDYLNYDSSGPQEFDYISYFNFDDIDCTNFASSVIPLGDAAQPSNEFFRVVGLLSQRYCQWKQDFIQSALPSTQFGAVSEVVLGGSLSSTTGDAIYDNVSRSLAVSVSGTQTHDIYTRWADDGSDGNQPGYLRAVGATGSYPQQIQTPHVHSLGAGSAGFDVLALRRAEALQKWRQNALRAGNMVDDAFEAHFGVKPRFESDNNVVKLGSFESILQINAVEATAYNVTSDSVNGNVGDLAATGTSVTNGRALEYDATDFGVILCMAYFRPEAEYNSTMIDKCNRLTDPFDFYTPEFQNTGLDPVTLTDYNPQYGDSPNTVFGFAPQYWWYKTALDKVHGQFSDFMTNLSGGNTHFRGEFLPWVSPRNITMTVANSGDIMRTRASLYVSPNVLDNVFAVNYDGHNDTFLCNAYFDVKSIRPMSVIGLPQF